MAVSDKPNFKMNNETDLIQIANKPGRLSFILLMSSSPQKVGSRKLPEEPSTPSSPTPSSPATPRRGISFYVEVDSPHSPRSPRPSLARRNTIASPRSASPGSSSDLHRMADKISSPRSGRRNSGEELMSKEFGSKNDVS